MEKRNIKEIVKNLLENGEVSFEIDGTVVAIWEADQGDENIRGEDYMSYMYSLYDAVEYHSCEDPEDFDSGLCTGYARNAIEMALDLIQ